MTPEADGVAPATVSTELLRGGVLLIRVEGELDLAAANIFGAALGGATEDGGQAVVDLSGCTFIDSSGISAIFRALRRDGSAAPALAIAGAAGQVERVLRLIGVDDSATLHANVDEASAALRPSA